VKNMNSDNFMADVKHIAIDEKEVRHLTEYKRSRMIGRVFQDPMAGTAPTMTIQENLAIAYSRNKPRNLRSGVNKKRRDLFKSYLQTLNLGLDQRLNARVGLLSGGE